MDCNLKIKQFSSFVFNVFVLSKVTKPKETMKDTVLKIVKSVWLW